MDLKPFCQHYLILTDSVRVLSVLVLVHTHTHFVPKEDFWRRDVFTAAKRTVSLAKIIMSNHTHSGQSGV